MAAPAPPPDPANQDSPGGGVAAHGGPTVVRDSLRIYFVDVEGGQATLFVMPSGESMLVDAGWPGHMERDADRIVALCKLAGVTKIDNLVVTHYHIDHAGGVPQLAAKIPIGRFIDHGINRESAGTVAGASDTVAAWTAYQKVLAEGHAEHLVAKPGDVLPVKGMHVEVVSADGEVIGGALPEGGKENAECDASPVKEAEGTENDRSAGLLITFGQLRIVDLGDLTWAKERGLVCPVNKLGAADVYIVSHHGSDRSGSPALLEALSPRVAIMDNGANKGGSPETYETFQGLSTVVSLWQLHTAEGNDAQHNATEAHTANLTGTDVGYYLRLTAHPDGGFSVMNSRTGASEIYRAR
jgi:beta-lactamase superfamily II metal-dependent hydrolase